MSKQITSSPSLTSITLSLVSSPFLIAMLASEKIAESMIKMGQASEEIFRGERLPILSLETQTSKMGVNQE